jgi:hypothetical protein
MQRVDFDMPVTEIVENFYIEPKMQRVYDESLLIEAIKKIESSRYMPSERKAKSSLVEHIVDEWFSQRFREKYQELSPEIFDLKRKVEIKTDEISDYRGNKVDGARTFNLEIPMFAEAELGKETEWKKEFSIGERSSDYKVSLSSKVPHIPSSIRQARKEVLTFVYSTYSNALKTDLLNDVILENPEYAPNPANSRLVVIWKPKSSEIHATAKRVDRDPALILRYNKPYLISTWTEPREEPFMGIISACRMPGKIQNLEKYMK